jgi:ethanolamine utilization protein EutA (predicted chaperonin)
MNNGLRLRDLDYVDIGALHEPAHLVPVMINSLLF